MKRTTFSYEQAFNRNQGLLNIEEQESLRNSRIAIAGCGGIGGALAEALARLGIGNFTLADLDTFELGNFNRQFGARIPTIGKKKTAVTQNMIHSINADAKVKVIETGITPETVDIFLQDVDVVLDALDFYAFKERLLLNRKAREKNIWVINVAPAGFGSTLLVFDPKGMSLEDYFDVNESMPEEDWIFAQMYGLNPTPFILKYLDIKTFTSADKGLPCIAPAFFLAAGIASTEAMNILLEKKTRYPVPHVFQFDALLHQYRRHHFRFGMKAWEHRLKKAFLRKFLFSGTKIHTPKKAFTVSQTTDDPTPPLVAKHSKPRILFVAEAATLTHVVRPLMLAKSLNPDFFDIHFACAENDLTLKNSKIFKDFPFTRWTIDSMQSRDFLRRVELGKVIFDRATLEHYVENDLKLLRDLQPDMVIGDLRPSLAVSTEVCKIPYLPLVNAYWSPYKTIEEVPIPEIPFTRFLGSKFTNKIFNQFKTVALGQHAAPVNTLRKKYGLRPLGDLRSVYNYGKAVLYADAPILVPTKSKPAHHHYLGAIFWPADEIELPSWWNDLDPKKPTIYVTLGSSGDPHVLPTVVKALGKLPVQVMLSTINCELKDIPNNFFVASYLPGRKASERADLIICNGGSAGYQALKAGIPVLGIASNMDQLLSMQGVEKIGAGICVRSGSLTEEIIAQTIRSFLNHPSYGLAAHKVSEGFARYEATNIFPKLMENFFLGKGKLMPQFRSTQSEIQKGSIDAKFLQK